MITASGRQPIPVLLGQVVFAVTAQECSMQEIAGVASQTLAEPSSGGRWSSNENPGTGCLGQTWRTNNLEAVGVRCLSVAAQRRSGGDDSVVRIV